MLMIIRNQKFLKNTNVEAL